MLGTLFIVLVLIALASSYSNLAMRISLSKRLPLQSRLSWWMSSSDEVARAYQNLFPKSYLPSVVHYGFWLLITMATAVVILISLTKSY